MIDFISARFIALKSENLGSPNPHMMSLLSNQRKRRTPELAVRTPVCLSRDARWPRHVILLPSIGVCLARTTREGIDMSKEQDNKAIVGRWFEGFWGNPYNPKIVDELAAPDVLLQYSLHAPRRGREDVKKFMTGFREAFPDLKFGGAADLIAEGDFVVGRWEGGGTHTGPAFSDFLLGSLPAASGRKMRFTGTTVLRVANGKIAEEIGLDDGVTALQQLGLITPVKLAKAA
jgi:predicted ester cyclase